MKRKKVVSLIIFYVNAYYDKMDMIEIKRNETISFAEIEKLTEWSSIRIEKALKGTYAQFSIRKGEELIAFARVISDGSIYSFIVDLTVTPDYRRQGIGKQLIMHIIGELKKDGIKYTELTFEDEKLEPLYRDCGFQIEKAGSILNE